MCDLSVILPTYNERDHIAELVSTLCNVIEPACPSFEILLVDDSSPDGTADEVRGIGDPRVNVHVRVTDRGLAKAVRYGLEHSRGRFLVAMDADFNHRPGDVPRLFAAAQRADVAVGSRYVRGGGMEGPTWRYWGSWLINRWIQLRLGSRVRDNTSGFLCFSRDVLQSLDAERIFYGYGDYAIRFLYLAQQKGWRVAEVPVVYSVRKSGASKTRFVHYLGQYLQVIEDIRRP